MGEHVERTGGDKYWLAILKGPLERSRYRWGDIIKMNTRGKGLEIVHWINLPQGRCRWRAFVDTAMKLLLL
jgi:hypothetical protein